MTAAISQTSLSPEEHSEKKSEKAVRDWSNFVAVYEALRDAARRRMSGPNDELSLGPTGLVHEVFIKLEKDPKVIEHPEPSFLFASGLRAMREILIDRAKARGRLKRGGGHVKVFLDEAIDYIEAFDFDVVEIHEAIDRLERLDQRQAIIVTLRYFLRMTNAEVATLLDVSVSTVESDLRFARAWLRYELKDFDIETPPNR